MTTATAARALGQELETLRNAQMILTAAIQHAKEEALAPPSLATCRFFQNTGRRDNL